MSMLYRIFKFHNIINGTYFFKTIFTNIFQERHVRKSFFIEIWKKTLFEIAKFQNLKWLILIGR